MAEMHFTKDQQKVIDKRGGNLLVSAAAGSGKTAVLIERILDMISGPSKVTDIDRILVVTFTRNAASQMKERLLSALEKRLSQNENDRNLLRQMELIHNANITTIDSFCQTVVKSYFQQVDIDPNFRIGEETELKILWSEVVETVLEEHHLAGDIDFCNLADAYGGQSDERIADYITKLKNFSNSSPWPEEFLSNATKNLEWAGTFEELPILSEVLCISQQVLLDSLALSERAGDLCRKEGGPKHYAEAVDSDTNKIKLLLMANSYTSLGDELTNLSFDNLSSKRTTCDESLKSQVMKLRDKVKKLIKKLIASFYYEEPSAMLEDMAVSLPMMKSLTSLTMECRRRYLELLKKNNVYGFPEIEHFALQILVSKQAGEMHFSEAARNYHEQFDEIMIDEYQDSNLVQDLILRSVSMETVGGRNIFMVGDIKQSIYRFRMARPELFLEKYGAYQVDNSWEERIDLSMNFRSRKKVLEVINHVFERIMTKALGGIAYDGKARLYHGATDGEYLTESQTNCELVLLETKPEDSASEQKEYSAEDLYVAGVIDKIKELTCVSNGYRIKDGEELRPVRYGDIVLLVRALSNVGYALIQGLLDQGIDAYATSLKGYFTSMEVSKVLNLLRILDNPLQDIPMASVLHSMMFEWNEEELSRLRLIAGSFAAKGKDSYLYEALVFLSESTLLSTEQMELAKKAQKFIEVYERLFNQKQICGIGQLVESIFEETGFYDLCACMAGGDTRRNNLDSLLLRARGFENNSYGGLSDFVSYIDHMMKYEIKVEDTSAANLNNSIRVMTIHSSKGLEFPIVIMPELSHEFNLQDLEPAIILHEELGLGPTAIDLSKRTKIDTLQKRCIVNRLRQESLAEELRVLYTAMTRAKDKLILFGKVKKRTADLQNYELLGMTNAEGTLLYTHLLNAKGFQDWIMGALFAGGEFTFDDVFAAFEDGKTITGESLTCIPLSYDRCIELYEEQKRTNTRRTEGLKLEELTEEKKQILEERLNYTYPYEKEAKLPVKFSVSELKMAAMEEMAEAVNMPSVKLEHEPPAALVPHFLETQKETVLKGSDRGTLYHRALELHDFGKELTVEEVNEELSRQIETKLLDSGAKEAVSVDKLVSFYASSAGKRMHEAAVAGRLFKEQAFVMSMKANDINKEYQSEEAVLIQGIIDVFFEEAGEIVLLDYKTDRVNAGNGEEILRDRYLAQLQYYGEAITKATGKRVKELLIYSFALQKEIKL